MGPARRRTQSERARGRWRPSSGSGGDELRAHLFVPVRHLEPRPDGLEHDPLGDQRLGAAGRAVDVGREPAVHDAEQELRRHAGNGGEVGPLELAAEVLLAGVLECHHATRFAALSRVRSISSSSSPATCAALVIAAAMPATGEPSSSARQAAQNSRLLRFPRFPRRRSRKALRARAGFVQRPGSAEPARRRTPARCDERADRVRRSARDHPGRRGAPGVLVRGRARRDDDEPAAALQLADVDAVEKQPGLPDPQRLHEDAPSSVGLGDRRRRQRVAPGVGRPLRAGRCSASMSKQSNASPATTPTFRVSSSNHGSSRAGSPATACHPGNSGRLPPGTRGNGRQDTSA